MLALLVERIAEIRAGDTWRNLTDQLDRIKVVEYEHNGARVRQNREIDRELAALLAKLGVPLPPKRVRMRGEDLDVGLATAECLNVSQRTRGDG
jgi:hypothetical protein